MGYWSADKRHNETYKEWANRKYSYENDMTKHTVLDAALVNFHELYVACAYHRKQDGVKFTYCMVVKLVGKGRNMMSKEMDESCGPVYTNCPERIFKLLSPLRKLGLLGEQLRWARNWRESVQRNFKIRDMVKSLQYASIICFNKPISFQNNTVHATMFKVINEKKMHFCCIDAEEKLTVKLSKSYLLEHSWSVVS